MKKYRYIFILTFSIVFTNCEDKLSLTPHDAELYENAFASKNDFTFAMHGAYEGLRQGGYHGGQYLIYGDILADNAILCSSGRTSKSDEYSWMLTGNNTWDLLWNDAYETILSTNLILENIDVLEEGTTFKDEIRGEAMAIRALAHMDMVIAFGNAPMFAAAGDLGVPYVTSSDPSLMPTRNTVAETYDFIEQDFIAAAALLPAQGNIGRIGRDAVNGFMSRLYLYTGDWANAVSAATACIDAQTAGLNDATTFGDIWLDKTEQGVVFKVKIHDVDDIQIGVEYSQTSPTSGVRSEYVADFDFFNSYAVGDIRASTYFSTSAFDGKNWNHIAKHFGRETGDANVTDSKVLRLAEVLLNRAEAHYEVGGASEAAALADLNELRTNRGLVAGTETGAALLTSILDERRKELAYEGHRFWDLKRRNLPVNRSATTGDEADGTGIGYPVFALSLPAGDNKFSLPIIQDELNVNPNMVQNPGY